MKRTALITGGSRGIGKAIVSILKKEEFTVLAPDRSELDLLNDESIAAYGRKIRNTRIDVLINNAGINAPQWIEEMTDENIVQTIQVNLIAPVKLIRAAVPGMKKRRWGRIINISSMFGVIARGKQALYVATKHGINGITKSLALELAPNNILVNSVCPGFTATDLVLRNAPDKIKSLERDIPIGRLADPREIAKLVRFLVSDENSYMTGSIVVIDGGYTCK
ncbi:SDR family oxidoreductase [Candidatus Gottesmanbacteria bacterium]|nr:SDR family oxidoreductase [Candidatus Gottesmanbacteria bacterium]